MDAIYNPRVKTYQAPTNALAEVTHCQRFLFPRDPTLIAAVNDVLAYLGDSGTWTGDPVDVLTMQNAINTALLYSTVLSDCEDEDMPIGTVTAFIGVTPPPNWLICDGSVYQRADYPELYNVMPAVFQIDETTFNVPDMVQKFIRGADDEFPVATYGGNDRGTSDFFNTVPLHNHSIQLPATTTINVQTGDTEITVLDPINQQGYWSDNAGTSDFKVIPRFLALHWIVRAR